MPDFLVGLDLGQAADYTALAVLKRSLVLDEAGAPLRTIRHEPVFSYVCNHLVRFELGTSYPTIVAAVAALVRRPELRPVATLDPRLVIDATGVGRPVVDMFLNERMPAEIVPVTITGGDTVKREPWNHTRCRSFRTPKAELASAVQSGLQSQRLKVVPALALADTLKKELLGFQIKVNANAHEQFGAWREGAHDDLVLAVALPLWLGGRRECPLRTDWGNLGDADYRAIDMEYIREKAAADRAEKEKLEQAEHEHLWGLNSPVWHPG
jgi:hypothetical protein